MLTITDRLLEKRAADLQLVLPFEVRSRSRFRATLSSGEEVGVVLARGQILRDGDLLLTADGRVVAVAASAETVSTARSDDPRLLTRVAYHLGNRHVALQIGSGWVRYGGDHVLDDMVRGFGVPVTRELAPFEPEAGAYHAPADHGHSHGHSHGH